MGIVETPQTGQKYPKLQGLQGQCMGQLLLKPTETSSDLHLKYLGGQTLSLGIFPPHSVPLMGFFSCLKGRPRQIVEWF